MDKNKWGLAFLSALLLNTLGFHLPTHAQDNTLSPDSAYLSIGKVSIDPRTQYSEMMPMANFISEYLGLDGGKTIFTKSIEDMQTAFSQNRVDLFTGSAYEAGILINAGLAEAIAVKLKQGEQDYRSIIVTRKDSSIISLGDLDGKLIGFEDKGSTSAYVVPRLELEKSGFRLEEETDRPEKIDLEGESFIHYRFYLSEQNSAVWLAQRLVDAIAISDSDWNNSNVIPEFLKKEFQIIHSSPPIPRAIEVVRSNLPETMKQQIQNALFYSASSIQNKNPIMHFNTIDFETADLQTVLFAYHQAQGFQTVSDDTNDYIKELARLHNSKENQGYQAP